MIFWRGGGGNDFKIKYTPLYQQYRCLEQMKYKNIGGKFLKTIVHRETFNIVNIGHSEMFPAFRPHPL